LFTVRLWLEELGDGQAVARARTALAEQREAPFSGVAGADGIDAGSGKKAFWFD
jgi:hypothetical protein